PLWVACEWARLGVTGQLWNALGYSQAYHPALIQTARWGGVYAIGFLLVTVNAALTFALLRRTARAALTSLLVVFTVALMIVLPFLLDARRPHTNSAASTDTVVIAVQPNVAVNFDRAPAETAALITQHLSLSADALRRWDETQPARA